MTDPDPQPTVERKDYTGSLARQRLEVSASGPWERLGTSLFIAGGVYPLVLWVVLVVIGAVGLLVTAFQRGFDDLLYVPAFLGISLLAAIIAGFFTLFYTGVVTVIALLVTAGVVKVLRLDPRWQSLGTFCGSWVAFLCFLPLTMAFGDHPNEMANAWPLLAAGPALAIAWGMVVGAYSGIGNHRRFSRGAGATHRMRFSIQQMMMLTLVASLALGLLRLAQMLNSTTLFSLGLWLGCLLVFYWPATRIARCLYRRRAQRYLRYRHRRRITSREAAGAEMELGQT